MAQQRQPITQVLRDPDFWRAFREFSLAFARGVVTATPVIGHSLGSAPTSERLLRRLFNVPPRDNELLETKLAQAMAAMQEASAYMTTLQAKLGCAQKHA